MTAAAAPDAASLVALVGSRITHDLANPIGAIANGVELLELAGPDAGPELALITESVETARARIKRFRIAFGAAAPGQIVSEAELTALARPPAEARRITLDWPVSGSLARAEAKLALLGLMCLETALPRGGHIAISGMAGAWRLVATAERLTVDDALWACLEGHSPAPADLTPAQVQFALLAIEAASQGRRPRVDRGEGRLALWL